MPSFRYTRKYIIHIEWWNILPPHKNIYIYTNNIYYIFRTMYIIYNKRKKWMKATDAIYILAKSHFPKCRPPAPRVYIWIGQRKNACPTEGARNECVCVTGSANASLQWDTKRAYIRRVLLYFVFHSALLACKQSWNLFSGVKCFQDAVHITAILGESVVFNCHVEFPGDHPVPYVLQWEKKVGDTVGHQTLLSNLNPLGYYDSRGARQSQYIRGTGRRSYYQTWVAITFVTGTERDNALLH